MYFGWTPPLILSMKAHLFFEMLGNAREIEHRKQYRSYYEMTRISAFPHYTVDNQLELQNYYWNRSLSIQDRQSHEEFKEQMETRANQFMSNSEAFDLLRTRHSKVKHG